MSGHVLEHPSIGAIRGLTKSADVTQYLGVQYACLKDRLSRGELLLSPPPYHPRRADNVLDATRNG